MKNIQFLFYIPIKSIILLVATLKISLDLRCAITMFISNFTIMVGVEISIKHPSSRIGKKIQTTMYNFSTIECGKLR